MTLTAETIDRIVANVLGQLGTAEKSASTPAQSDNTTDDAIELADSVVTAALLEPMTPGARIVVGRKSIITPSASDIVRERRLNIQRINDQDSLGRGRQRGSSTGCRLSAAIVQYPETLQQAIQEISPQTQELFGCPDDAAKFAISEICRGAADRVLVLAEQAHRAACLANRNGKVKAVCVQDSGDIKAARTQLRVNTWCINPTGRSYYEFKNIFRVILEQQ